MEQQLDATYLRPSFASKAFALSIAAVGIGTGVLLASYGLSLVWHPARGIVDIRIANPEIHVTQEKPFVMASPEPLRTDARDLKQPEPVSSSGRPKGVADPIFPSQEVIQQEVIVFSTVKHAAGSIVTGWKYPNGSGRTPSEQFCYYISPNADKSSTKVNIALNGAPLSETAIALVPESEQAIKKCQWWHA
jgi:hypothetical protein